MEIKRVKLKSCTLNLGELHHLTDFGFFHPVFHCKTEDGDEFVAKMRLHITEPLEKLIIVDPRVFNDGGYAANSAHSKILKRRSAYTDANSTDNFILNPALLNGKPLYEISAREIKKALLNGYDFQLECNKAKQVQNKELKIAFTCHDPQIISGGNIILFRYLNWLAELGVRSTVYSCRHHPSWIRVQARFCNYSNYPELFSAIEEDVVVLYSMWHIEPMLKTVPREKRIYHLRQIYEPCHYGKDYKSMLARKPVIELLESLPLGVIAISPHIQQWYKEQLGIASLLITNGIDTRLFSPCERPKPNLKIKTVVSVGNPRHFVKGADVLADALLIATKRNPDWQINWTVISGYGGDADLDKTLAENLAVNYQSGLSQYQMREIYRSTDIVVNPSLYEGCGLPTLEAMACGAPVVQADNHGLDFIIENNRDCLIVPVNDSKHMAEAIEKILRDNQLATHLRSNGIETARSCSTAHQFDMFVNAFEQILKTRFPVEDVQAVRSKLAADSFGVTASTASNKERSTADKNSPLVSVVVPTYNQAEYLREALDSLLAQTYHNWEAIVVNDGSTDNTSEVMCEYAKRDSRIRPITKANGGITSALNDGLKHAEGDYFCWLSSDDLYYPEKLEILIKAFENLGDDYALVYGSFDLLQEETHTIETQPFAKPITAGAEFPEALKFDFIDGCSMMIRMDVMREVGGFNPHYHHSQDMELWMRIASRGYRFHLVNKKVTIRRVHVEQASTTNMIHCRYDAAWMVNYYLEHFHLLEMYRYFDLTQGTDIDRLVNHYVGRMLHTEANVNHPLIQEKFWRWFDHGLTALAPKIQIKILKKCLNLLLSNSSVTYKVEYYIKECLTALSKEREYIPFAPNFTVEGRDIRYDNREKDEFAKVLFDYGTDLLINEHTPLFAQELYFHNTNKIVDTPFKLAHSVFRYLSQFPNPYREIVERYVDISEIPVTQSEAIRLFSSLRYPEYSHALQKSLAFNAEKTNNLDGISECEDLISQMPLKYKEDLPKVCRKNPTATILHYWNALALANEGRFVEALTEGWKTLTLNRRSCDWRIAYRLGIWAEKVNDFEKAAIAYSMGHGCNPCFLPFTEGLDRVSQKTSSFSQYIPTPKQFIFTEEDNEIPSVTLSNCKIFPLLDNNYILDLTGISENKKTFSLKGKLPYAFNLKDIRLTDPYTNKRLKVSANSIFNLWAGGYNFINESFKTHKKLLNNNNKISVAFTILNSSILGGGPLIVYRYINWLSALGVDVAVYSNDTPPAWSNINARFYHIANDTERYSSIVEPVVIVYSILELPTLLCYCNTKSKRIFHICQGVEDFNYHGTTFASLIAPKPIFEILHSLPVGRLAVSPHIQDYFYKQYGQRAYTILNGIDLNTYAPRWKRSVNNKINVLIVGNPERLLKGAGDVKEALLLLAKKHPEWKLHLIIVSGQKVPPNYNADSSILGFTHFVHWGLSPEELREMYYAADVYINSAWYEGFGLPTVEAMACGVPVIQVNNQGLNGIADDGQNCLIVPPQSPRKMAETLEILIKDNELRERLIKNGLETASRFSLKNQYEMFVTEFENILNCKFDGELVKATKQDLECGTLKDRLRKITSRFQPLISVLVPTYNQAKYLPAALDSLIAQTYGNWEAIVVNDGSTDETPLIMERYAGRDQRIRLFHKENGGVASALNEGLRNARGQWIFWLSSDDLFEPYKLAVHIKAIEEKPEIKFFHSHYYYLDEQTGIKKKVHPNLHNQLPLKAFQVLRFFFNNYIHGNSVAIHHSVFDRVGNFNEELRYGQDFDMWLRISALYPSYFINERTCVTRWHAEQTTNELPLAGIYDSARACLDFLNRREFPAIFPDLDLSKPEQALFAIENTFKVLVNPASFINRCGYGPALIDRLREWLTQSASAAGKTVIKSQLANVLSDVQQTNLSEEIKAAFQAMHEALERPFQYKSYEPIEEIVRHTIRLVKKGNIDEASGLRRYIERISPQIDQHPNIESHQALTDQHSKELFSADKIKKADSLERYSPLINSNEEKTPIRSNLKYWQQLQDNGYFEKHPDYSGLKEYGEDYNIINKHIPLSKEMNVLVIGCGYGREILQIAHHVKHVYGIDVNRNILDKADNFLAERGITNFTSVLADEWKDVVPNNIDLVYSIIVFQHLTRDLVKDYIHGLTKKLSPDGKFLCQFAELDLGTHDAELRPYEPNVRWSKTEIEQLIKECDLTKNSIQTQEAYGQGNWHWAFFGKQEAKLPKTKILFYYDRISNFDGSPAGTIIAILNFARAILRDRPNVTIHLTGNLVRHPEQFESFQVIPLPPPGKREEFLADYDMVFFATHIRYFKGLTKPSGQLWVLYQHCWEADDPVSLAHMNDFDAVICLSELHRACLRSQGIGVEKLVTIPNLIDTDIYSPEDISRNNRSIMFAGGLHPHKCIHVLLDAFRLVRRQVAEAELHIYGDGAMWRGGDDYGNRLKTLKQEGVYFHGYVDNKDMPQVYSKHSILCLPSKLESFGLVTVEAQACGCIPVVHNVGGVAATLADGQTGLLYSLNTVEKLAEAIVKAMALVDADSSVRRRAIDFVCDNFSINKSAEYIPKLWKRLAIAKESNAVKTLFESNDTNSAGAGCERLLQKYPDQPDLLLLQALIVLRQGDKERCKSMLLNLIEKFGMHQMTLNNIGVLLMDEGNSNEALEYFVRAYNVNPCDKNTSLNCSAAWKICGKYNEARMVLFNYLTKVGEDAQALQLLEEINNLIAGASSGANVIFQQRRGIDDYKAGDIITVVPYYEPSLSDPLVSVIMPAYNSADYIGQAIESVLIQNYPKFELLIVDDGSTDNTREVILQYKDERIKYFYKENGGPSSARNHAIKQAKGQYIMPLDADDMMVPNFIISHLKEFEKNPEADLVYSDVLLIDEVGNPIKVMNKPEYQDRRHLIRDLFRRGHPIVPFRLGLRRSVFDKIGLYDETLMIAEDYDMMRRFVKAGLKAHHLSEVLHIRRMRSDNISRTVNVHKAKNHFDVVKRFTDTFRYDELFPDVAWDKIRPEMRQLHAKCLAAVNCVAIGRTYVEANSPIYAKTAFELACSELNNCIRMDPNNSQLHQLLQQCESVRAKYEKALPQTVC